MCPWARQTPRARLPTCAFVLVQLLCAMACHRTDMAASASQWADRHIDRAGPRSVGFNYQYVQLSERCADLAVVKNRHSYGSTVLTVGAHGIRVLPIHGQARDASESFVIEATDGFTRLVKTREHDETTLIGFCLDRNRSIVQGLRASDTKLTLDLASPDSIPHPAGGCDVSIRNGRRFGLALFSSVPRSVGFSEVGDDGQLGVHTSVPLLDMPIAAVGCDLERDGREELVVACSEGSVSAFQLCTDGLRSRSFIKSLPTVLRDMGAADLDSDGYVDLVLLPFAERRAWIAFGAEGGFHDAVPVIDCGGHPSAMTISDIDGDGQLDIVIVGGTRYQPLLARVGEHRVVNVEPLSDLSVGPAFRLDSGDLDGDGVVDIVAGGPFMPGLAILWGR